MRKMAMRVAVFGLVLLCLVVANDASKCKPEGRYDCSFAGFAEPAWYEARKHMAAYQELWQSLSSSVAEYPTNRFSGRGIVIPVQAKDLPNVPIVSKVLKALGNELPLQVWHAGDIPSDLLSDLEKVAPEVRVKNLLDSVPARLLHKVVFNSGNHSFIVKPLAALHSEFEEVLLLDADNLPLQNPAQLFRSAEFVQAGALFWPDFWTFNPENPIHDILNVTLNGPEQESGQLLIKKSRTWRALNLAVELCRPPFASLINGDKDTFQLAWKYAATTPAWVQTRVASAGVVTSTGFCGHTMVQHDLKGLPLFLHHNMMKFGRIATPGRNWGMLKYLSTERDGTFTVLPKPALDSSTSCLDLVGPSVKFKLLPFPDIEELYEKLMLDIPSTLMQAHEAMRSATRRKLLQSNTTASVTLTGVLNEQTAQDVQRAITAVASLQGASLQGATIIVTATFQITVTGATCAEVQAALTQYPQLSCSGRRRHLLFTRSLLQTGCPTGVSLSLVVSGASAVTSAAQDLSQTASNAVTSINNGCPKAVSASFTLDIQVSLPTGTTAQNIAQLVQTQLSGAGLSGQTSTSMIVGGGGTAPVPSFPVGGPTCPIEAQNPCFNRAGSFFVCCTGSCGSFAPNGDPTCKESSPSSGGSTPSGGVGSPGAGGSTPSGGGGGSTAPLPSYATGGPTCGAEAQNACYSRAGSFFICCADSCGNFAPNGDPTCKGSSPSSGGSTPSGGVGSPGAGGSTPSVGVGGSTAPVPSYPTGGPICGAEAQNACYNRAGSFFICCADSCGNFAPNGNPTCKAATPMPGGVSPSDGVCDPYSQYPNQCYNRFGLQSVCCSGQCPSQPGDNPTCA